MYNNSRLTNLGNIGIIGGTGHLGSVLSEALAKECPEKTRITISNSSGNFDRIREAISGRANVQFTTDNDATVRDSDTIIFAVKPQIFKEQNGVIRDVSADKLLISVMAGIRIATLQQLTGAQKIVRAMPNLAAKVRRSATGWMCSEAVTKSERAGVQSLLEKIGKAYQLETEDQMDEFTVRAGSAPGLFAEISCTRIALSTLGLSEEDEITLELELNAGYAEFCIATGTTPAQLRANMTSIKGTTHAAVEAFRGAGGADALDASQKAGVARALALN